MEPVFLKMQRGLLFFLFVLMLFAFGGSRYQGQETASEHYRKAKEAESIRDYRKAIQLYRKALESNPRHISSYLRAAEIYMLLGEYKQAKSCYKNILSKNPKNIEALTGLALASIELNQDTAANKILSLAQKEEPSNVKVNYVLGLWHTKQGNRKSAQRFYEKSLRSKPTYIPSLTALSRLFIERGNPSRAKEYLERARSVLQEVPDIYETQGRLDMHLASLQENYARRTSLLESAYEHFLTAQRLSPQNTEIAWELIRTDIYLERYEKAVAALSDLKKDLPNNAKIRYLLALLRFGQGPSAANKEKNIRGALQDLKLALAFEPHNPFIRHTLESTVLQYAQRKNLGVQILREKLADYHIREAQKEKKQYRYDLFQAHLRRALYLHPLLQEGIKLQLPLLKKKKDYGGLTAAYRKLQKENPKDQRLRYRLAVLLREREKNVFYRESLLYSELAEDKFSFLRSSKRIFVFDIKAEAAFPFYPNLSQELGRALTSELALPGPVQSIDEKKRSALLKYTTAHSGKLGSQKKEGKNIWSVPYNSKSVRYIHDSLKKDHKSISYLLTGSYRILPKGGIEAVMELRESHIGARLVQFRIKTKEKNILLRFAHKTRLALLRYIPVEGKIVKVNGKNIFVNLGTYDGLNLQSRLSIPRISYKKGMLQLQIEELGAYLSRVSLIKDTYGRQLAKGKLEKGENVLLLKNPKL